MAGPLPVVRRRAGERLVRVGVADLPVERRGGLDGAEVDAVLGRHLPVGLAGGRQPGGRGPQPQPGRRVGQVDGQLAGRCLPAGDQPARVEPGEGSQHRLAAAREADGHGHQPRQQPPHRAAEGRVVERQPADRGADRRPQRGRRRQGRGRRGGGRPGGPQAGQSQLGGRQPGQQRRAVSGGGHRVGQPPHLGGGGRGVGRRPGGGLGGGGDGGGVGGLHPPADVVVVVRHLLGRRKDGLAQPLGRPPAEHRHRVPAAVDGRPGAGQPPLLPVGVPPQRPAARPAQQVPGRPDRPPGRPAGRPHLAGQEPGLPAPLGEDELEPVEPVGGDERQVRADPLQPLPGRGRHLLRPAGAVDPLGHHRVPHPHPLEERVADQVGHHPGGPPAGPHPPPDRHGVGGQPVGHLGEPGPVLQEGEDALDDRGGGRVLADVRVRAVGGRLEVAERDDLHHPAGGEAVAEGAADTLRGVRVAGLVLEGGEEGAQPPPRVGRVEVVVDGYQAGVVVFAQLAEVDGPVAAADAAEVLDHDQVVPAALDGRLGVGQLLAVEVLAAAAAGDHPDGGRGAVAVGHPPPAQGGLVVQAAGVLVGGADAGDDEDVEGVPVAGHQGGVVGHGSVSAPGEPSQGRSSRRRQAVIQWAPPARRPPAPRRRWPPATVAAR